MMVEHIHKEYIYVNIISKNDYRYNIIETKINNKKNLINTLNIGNNGLNYYIDIIFTGLIFSKKNF